MGEKLVEEVRREEEAAAYVRRGLSVFLMSGVSEVYISNYVE